MRFPLIVGLCLVLSGCASGTASAPAAANAAAPGRPSLRSMDSPECIAARARARDSSGVFIAPPSPIRIIMPPVPIPTNVPREIAAKVYVDSSGKVTNVVLTPAPSASFARQMEKAMRSSPFYPGVHDGCAVSSSNTLTFTFNRQPSR